MLGNVLRPARPRGVCPNDALKKTHHEYLSYWRADSCKPGAVTVGVVGWVSSTSALVVRSTYAICGGRPRGGNSGVSLSTRPVLSRRARSHTDRLIGPGIDRSRIIRAPLPDWQECHSNKLIDFDPSMTLIISPRSISTSSTCKAGTLSLAWIGACSPAKPTAPAPLGPSTFAISHSCEVPLRQKLDHVVGFESCRRDVLVLRRHGGCVHFKVSIDGDKAAGRLSGRKRGRSGEQKSGGECTRRKKRRARKAAREA